MISTKVAYKELLVGREICDARGYNPGNINYSFFVFVLLFPRELLEEKHVQRYRERERRTNAHTDMFGSISAVKACLIGWNNPPATLS